MGEPDQPRDKRGRWRKRGGGVLAAVIVALAAAFGSGSGTSISSGSGARAAQGTRGKARDRSSTAAVQRLARSGFQVRERATDAGSDCAAHSYGQVQEFFRTHPCEAYFRSLLEVREGPAVVLVAIAWVDMPDAEQARRLKALMDRHGTGNLTELSRERGGQRFTGMHYTSAREDTTVINVQAEPVGRTRVAITLARRIVETAG